MDHTDLDRGVAIRMSWEKHDNSSLTTTYVIEAAVVEVVALAAVLLAMTMPKMMATGLAAVLANVRGGIPK